MKHRCLVLITALLFLIGTCGFAEESAPLCDAVVTNGSRQVAFSYPQNCLMEDDRELGVWIYLDDASYVNVAIPRRSRSGTAKLAENIGSMEHITVLSDQLHVHASSLVRRDGSMSILSVGIDLDDGSGVILTSTCPEGQTAIYDIVRVILHSMMDTDLFDDWLDSTYLPSITAA